MCTLFFIRRLSNETLNSRRWGVTLAFRGLQSNRDAPRPNMAYKVFALLVFIVACLVLGICASSVEGNFLALLFWFQRGFEFNLTLIWVTAVWRIFTRLLKHWTCIPGTWEGATVTSGNLHWQYLTSTENIFPFSQLCLIYRQDENFTKIQNCVSLRSGVTPRIEIKLLFFS